MAPRTKDRARTSGKARQRRTARAPRRRLRLLWVVAILGSAIYLYYRPLASYFTVRNDLATQRAQVQALRAARDELRLRLVDTNSLESLEREARRIGYVRPGERLFVVKGIPDWRQAHSSARDRRP